MHKGDAWKRGYTVRVSRTVLYVGGVRGRSF
jgi:hypothetical protein